MARPRKTSTSTSSNSSETYDASADFAAELIKQLNKEHNNQIAFNLGSDDAPTNIKRWISTGSRQLDCIMSNKVEGGFPEGRIIEISGQSSCHGPDAEILMYDGTLKKSQDIQVGDVLMGPDSKPRTVLKTHSGVDEMFLVTQKRGGREYTFNQHHELALMNKKTRKLELIPIKDYIQKSNHYKAQRAWVHTGVTEFGNAISKQTKDVFEIPPYILGLLLGDGSIKSNRIELTTSDQEIANEYENFINSKGYKVSYHIDNRSKCFGIYHKNNRPNTGKTLDVKNDSDIIRKEMRTLGLLKTTAENKFIPQEYKTASFDARVELLAGLIDSDGYLNKNVNYDFVSKSEQLAKDVAFVARSVGLGVGESKKIINSQTYHRLCIFGSIEKIPSRLSRKQVIPEQIKRRRQFPLETGITVTPIGPGPFYGWTVDSDNLYLSDDFSIIKNSGKTHIAYEAIKDCQKQGGIAVYIDTENASSLENLQAVGIDVSKRFVFVQTGCTEEVFSIAESTIMKARAMTKDVPVLIVWDSVAGCSPKAELEGDYDQNSIGLQARAIGKGMRKIVNIIGNQNVTFIVINQLRKAIGVMFGDDQVTTGGMALPYACSTRIRITSTGQSHVKDKQGNVIGVLVKAKTIKNKVARPFRSVEFEIHFGKGVVEHEQVFDLFREFCSKTKSGVEVDGKLVNLEGAGAWKTFTVSNASTGEVEKEIKFYKPEFGDKVLYNPEFEKYMEALYEAVLVIKTEQEMKTHSTYEGMTTQEEMDTVREQEYGEKQNSKNILKG